MGNEFSSLGVSPPLIKAIKEMGFITPTNVQQKVIPHILEQKDLIVMSKTGSGKTGAFGIPLLQSIDGKGARTQGLVLTPTRELAVQVDQDFKKMSKYLDIHTTAIYGQHDIRNEIKILAKGTHVVTGTPGRVFDHIQRKTLETKNIRFVVIDEADRMLDMGFIDQVVQIIKKLPSKRVMLLFSATMPVEIQRICKAYMNHPLTVELQSDTKTVDTVKQVYYRVKANEKRLQLDRLLKVEQPDRCMIFCNTRDEVDRVQGYLSQKGYAVETLHGANSQGHRMRTLKKFKEGKLSIVVATDIAARGIHIEDLSLVINYDVPKDKDSYVHRIGRTARAGNSGKAIALATSDDIMSLYEIEEHVGVLVEEEDLPTDAYVKACVEKAQNLNKRLKEVPQVEDSQQQTRHKASMAPKVIKESNRLEESKVSKISQEPKTTEVREITEGPKVPEGPKMSEEHNVTIKKDEEVTIMIKNLGPVKVTYREESQGKLSFLKNLKITDYILRLFKKNGSNSEK